MAAQAACRARAWAPSIASGLRSTAASSVGHQHSRHYSPPTTHGASEPRWWYKADSYIRKLAADVQAGKRTATTAMTLNTATPLTPDLCHQVLMHLYRKVAALRVCFRQRGAELWLADMDTPRIDFQVVEGNSVEDVTKMTSHAAYNTTEGPLWRVRLVVCQPDKPCMLPRVKEAFPHQCHLVLDVHHAVYDGLCNIAISQLFLRTLDSMLDGVQIDDRQIGEFRDRSEMRTAEARIKESLEKDPHRLKQLLAERYKILTRTPLIIEALGEPKESSPDTNSLQPEILDYKLLQAFSAKCKAHNVTFNSSLIGAIGVALVELMSEAGVVRDSYVISTRHPVNTRRYMSGVASMVWGCHSLPMSLDMVTPWNARSIFWKHVANIDSKFRERIRKMGPVEDLVLDAMLQPTIPDRESKTIYDMALSNTYSPTFTMMGNGKHVNMSHFHYYSSLNGTEHKLLLGVFGCTSWAQLLLFHSPEHITKEDAVKLSDRIVAVLNDTAKALS